MKKLTLSALVVIASSAAASAALAQDARPARRRSTNAWPATAIGEGAKNKVGPELNGLDGRKSGTAQGYNYSDANKNSGITWNEAQFKEYIKDPEGEGSRHQDGIRRHQERERDQRSLGIRLAIRQGRKNQVTRLAAPVRRELALIVHAMFALDCIADTRQTSRDAGKSSGEIVPPIPIRVCRKIVVEVARVIRNLGCCPTRPLDFILGIRNFDFGDDQPVVIPVKNVDLPDPAGKNLAVPRLLDERSFAKLIQHHRRVGEAESDTRTQAGIARS